MRYGFLRALEQSGSIGRDAGWVPVYILVEQGPTDEVLEPPFHPYTRLLISSVPEMQIGWLEKAMETQEAQAGIDRVVKIIEKGCPFFDRCPRAMPGTCDVHNPPRRDFGDDHIIECHLGIEDFGQ